MLDSDYENGYFTVEFHVVWSTKQISHLLAQILGKMPCIYLSMDG